jgi:hypothetical protein
MFNGAKIHRSLLWTDDREYSATAHYCLYYHPDQFYSISSSDLPSRQLPPACRVHHLVWPPPSCYTYLIYPSIVYPILRASITRETSTHGSLVTRQRSRKSYFDARLSLSRSIPVVSSTNLSRIHHNRVVYTDSRMTEEKEVKV